MMVIMSDNPSSFNKERFLPTAVEQFLSDFPSEDEKSLTALRTPYPTVTKLQEPMDEYGDLINRHYPQKYQNEKALGLRMANGVPPLKRLTKRHLRIISLHMDGVSSLAIASDAGCSQSTVLRVLADPLATSILGESDSNTKREIRALVPKAVAAVREGLKSGTLGTKLKAIDKLKIMAEMTEAKEETQTAEDIISEILKKSNVQINVGQNVQVNNSDE